MGGLKGEGGGGRNRGPGSDVLERPYTAGGRGLPPPPLLPFRCLRPTAKFLLRRLPCQADLRFKNFRPAFGGGLRGTLGGGGVPAKPPPFPFRPPPPLSNPHLRGQAILTPFFGVHPPDGVCVRTAPGPRFVGGGTFRGVRTYACACADVTSRDGTPCTMPRGPSDIVAFPDSRRSFVPDVPMPTFPGSCMGPGEGGGRGQGAAHNAFVRPPPTCVRHMGRACARETVVGPGVVGLQPHHRPLLPRPLGPRTRGCHKDAHPFFLFTMASTL